MREGDELRMLRETAASFAANELLRDREETDRHPFVPLPAHTLEKAHRLGFFSLTVPEALGGGGQGTGALAALLTVIGETDASLGGIIFVNALAQEICLRSGAGEALAGLIEAESAAQALLAFPAWDDPRFAPPSLRAVEREGGWSLDGRAEYVALAGLALRALLPADSGRDGISFYMVDRGSGKLGLSDPLVSHGLRACPCRDLVLKQAPGTLVGEEGAGARAFEEAYGRMLPGGAALSAGILRGSLREALEYVKQRRQGGRVIAEWSEVRMILAGMAMASQEADMLVREACRAVEEGYPGWRLAVRAASLRAMDLACEATTDGIQLLGGNGYMVEYHQEKRFRDSRQVQALMGAQDLKRQELARLLLEEGLPG